MKKLMAGCESVIFYAAAAATFVLMLLTTFDAGGRYLFNRPILGAYEISTNYLMIAAVFLGMTYGYRKEALISVTFLTDSWLRPVKRGLGVFSGLITILYGALLVWATFLQAHRVMESSVNLSSFPIPLWPAYMIVPIGFFFCTLAMLMDMITGFYRKKS